VLLAGILTSYVIPFVVLAKPTPLSCAVLRLERPNTFHTRYTQLIYRLSLFLSYREEILSEREGKPVLRLNSLSLLFVIYFRGITLDHQNLARIQDQRN
jgi:hypothetical protein